MLTDADLDELLDEGWTPYEEHLTTVEGLSTPHTIPEGTVGGLTCRWKAPEESSSAVSDVTIVAIPESEVPEEFLTVYAEKRCDPQYGGEICRLSRIVNGVWIEAFSGYFVGERFDEPTAAFLERAVEAVANGVAARAGTAVPATPTADWWSPMTCEAFAEQMRFGELTEGGFESGYYEGGQQAEQTLKDSMGVSRYCPYHTADDRMATGQDHRIFSVDANPGGHWMWSYLSDGGTSVEADGATDAVLFTFGEQDATVFATDGANVVEVAGPEGVDFVVDIAERALEALAVR